MNRAKWSLLTPDEQQKKIAQLCGWKVVSTPFEDDRFKFWLVAPNGVHQDTAWSSEQDCWDGWRWKTSMPNYLKDLNAMREATMGKLTFCDRVGCDDNCGPGKWGTYERILAEIVTEDNESGLPWTPLVSEASAAQRAEAFVLTMEPEN